jgi:hypothetical protein
LVSPETYAGKMVPPPGAAPGYRNFQFRVSTAITKVAYWYYFLYK